ncbi:PQQ-dependent sugar dehydrogenase, partial [Pelagibacteraceae bacterium]|nr:PQQ-dependent sugar dehydrogenase [Pelagibacteraceae bacterium]
GWDDNLKNINNLLEITTDNINYEEFRHRSFFEFLDKTNNLIIIINPNGHLFYYDINSKKYSEINSNLDEIIKKNKISEKTPFLLNEKKEDRQYWLTSLGARDIAIANVNNKKYLFTLLSVQKDKYCMNDTVYKSEIKDQTASLEFTKVFQEDDCSFRGPNQASSRIEILDDNYLLITQGLGQIRDTSNKENNFSSVPVSDWPVGKLIKINIMNGNYEVITDGHRNPQGLTIINENEILDLSYKNETNIIYVFINFIKNTFFRSDKSNKVILSTEHGPRGGDEINIILENKNYGWPNVSYGISYGENISNWSKNHNNFQEPLYYFLPSIGISELEFYNHEQFPRWKKNLLVSSMKRGSLFRLDIDWKEKKVLGSEEIEIGCRIRDLEINNVGNIYMLCDNLDFIEISISDDDYK